MRKNIILTILVSATLIYTSLYSVENKIILTKTGHRKPPIQFDHKTHANDYGAKCSDCHHKNTNTKCSSCHLKKDQNHIINIKGAFHQQCHDCHRKTAGPKACGRCHISKKH